MDDKKRNEFPATQAGLNDEELNETSGGRARSSGSQQVKPVCVFCGRSDGVKFAEGHPLAYPTGRACVDCVKSKGIPMFL